MRGRRWLGVCCALGAAAVQAASYEEGLVLKQQQKLDAAAAEFRGVLAERPEDLKAREQLAVVESWRGQYDVSIAHWRQLIAAEPGNGYFRVGLARVQYWKRDYAAALESLDAAGGSYDARVLRGDVLLASGRSAEARASYEAARAMPDGAADAELARKLERAAPPRRWRIDAGALFDEFSAQRGSEGSQYAQIGYAFSQAFTGYLHYDRYDQFGARDHAVVAGAYWTPAPRWLLQGEAGVTVDDQDFRPAEQYTVNAEWMPEWPLQPLLGLRLAAYEDGDVETVSPGLRLLPGLGSVELRHAFSDNTDGSDTGVTSLRAGADFGRYSPYVLYANGEEALPPLAKARIEVFGAGLVVNLDAGWGLRFDYSYEDRQQAYIHHSLGAGLSYRF